jgi:transposase
MSKIIYHNLALNPTGVFGFYSFCYNCRSRVKQVLSRISNSRQLFRDCWIIICQSNKCSFSVCRTVANYKRRWKVERFFAGIQNYRRIVVRYEYHLDNFLGFIYLICIPILLKSYLRNDF